MPQRIRYHFRILTIWWAILLFVVMTAILVARARELGTVTAWLLVAASASFVIVPLVLAVTSRVVDRDVILKDGSIIVPQRLWEPTLELDNRVIQPVVEDQLGQRCLQLYNPGKTITITAAWLPDGALSRIVEHITGQPFIEPPPPKMTSFAVSWEPVLVKVLALLSFCGGPLYFADIFALYFDDPWDFIIAFAPVGVVVFASFSVLDHEDGLFERIVVALGGLSIVVVVLMSAYATVQILGGEERADGGLILFGSAVSFVATWLYFWLARRRRLTLTHHERGGSA